MNNNNNNMNMNTNNNNNNTNKLRQQQMQSSMFSNTAANNNTTNNPGKKKLFSSIMGSKGKDTPLLSFLRNKKKNNNSNSITSTTSQQQQQQQQFAAANNSNRSLVSASSHSLSSVSSDVLDAAPIDFSSSSNNPFLRKQMMSSLDRSVNRNSSTRGRLGGFVGSGLSSSVRRNMMQQMSTSGRLSKSCKELQRRKSSDSYESAGIISRHSSADHIPSVRLTAGAAKALNRRATLSRSNNSNSSFGNLTKTKSGSRRELIKSGTGGSSRSLPGKTAGSSTRSLGSDDSSGTLIPVKRGSMSGGRGGHGAKHKLGSSGSARRISSVPYMTSSIGDSASAIQQRMESQQHQLPRQNDSWS